MVGEGEGVFFIPFLMKCVYNLLLFDSDLTPSTENFNRSITVIFIYSSGWIHP